MSILKFIGNTAATSYRCSGFSEFLTWLENLEEVAFDTETNYTDSILSRKLKVLSLKSVSKLNRNDTNFPYLRK